MNSAIQVLDEQESPTIKLQGQLDEHLAPQLEDLLARLMADSKPIVIDFEKVPSVAPEGVRVLMNAHIQLQDVGALSLKSPNTEVKQLLTIVGLESLILYS